MCGVVSYLHGTTSTFCCLSLFDLKQNIYYILGKNTDLSHIILNYMMIAWTYYRMWFYKL